MRSPPHGDRPLSSVRSQLTGAVVETARSRLWLSNRPAGGAAIASSPALGPKAQPQPWLSTSSSHPSPGRGGGLSVHPKCLLPSGHSGSHCPRRRACPSLGWLWGQEDQDHVAGPPRAAGGAASPSRSPFHVGIDCTGVQAQHRASHPQSAHPSKPGV